MSALTLTLRQAAQLGDRPRDDFVLATLRHLPGAAVRGAFAAAWIAANGEPDGPGRDTFATLFEGGVRFGTLIRPGSEADSLAVVRHKYEPEASCGVIDYDRAVGQNPEAECPDCHSPLEPVRPGLFPDSETEQPAVRRRTSVAIGTAGVARRGQLFTRETLLPEQSFTGTLIAANPASLAALREIRQVRVGGRRTTHGLADITITDTPAPGPEVVDGTTLVIRLRSPGIFTDEFGRPYPEPSAAELTRVLDVPARVERRWARWQEVGGWHIASGLPKPAELAVAAGSTYQIHTERSVEPAALEHFARRGVGLRRHEGFGDLAGRPLLREGREAKEKERRRITKLKDDAAALLGVPVRFPDRWPGLRALLTAHGAGDAAAAGQLRRAAREFPDPGIAGALTAFLTLPSQDAAALAHELGRL